MSVDTLSEIATYIFTWNAHTDACPKCLALSSQEFRDQSIYQEVLFSHVWGDIWDLNRDLSLMHGASGTCRCQLTVRVEFDWANWTTLQEIHETNILFKALPGVA